MATELDLSQIVGLPSRSLYQNFTAVVDSRRLKPMQLYSVCVDYDGPNGYTFPTGLGDFGDATAQTNYKPLELDKIFVNPVKRFVPAGFVHLAIPSTLNMDGFVIDPLNRNKTALHVTDVLDVTPSGNSHDNSDLYLYFSMEKNCDHPEGDYFLMNLDVFTVTVIPRGAHICMRVVETLKGNSTAIVGEWGGDTSLKVEAILATHPEVFLTKFQVCEVPVWTPSLLTLLATGREVTLYGGSLGVEVILSGYKGGSVTGFQSTRIGPFTCYTHCADVKTTLRRLFLSSFGTLDQQLMLDSEKKRVDRNCFLNGLWCPSICEMRTGLEDADGFLIRSENVVSEWVAGEEFWLNLDYTQMRPGKHYSLCVYFNQFETAAATNPRFMTPTAARRLNDLWPDQYTNAELPSGHPALISPGYGNVTGENETQINEAVANYVKNDDFAQVVPSSYDVYISPLIQTEYRIIKADAKQQIRVFCPMLSGDIICHNQTAQLFLADNRDCLEANRRTSYASWRQVQADAAGYNPENSTSISSYKKELHAVVDDEVTLTDKRHYTFNRDNNTYLNETYIVTFDTSHLLTDYHYFLCIDVDGLAMPMLWNSSIAGWSGITVYVTPIYSTVEFTSSVRRNETQPIRVLAEKGLEKGWLDTIIPADYDLTYGEAREVVTRNCRLLRSDLGEEWVQTWQEVDMSHLAVVNYSDVNLLEEPFFYVGIDDVPLSRGGESSDGTGYGMDQRDWDVLASHKKLPQPGNAPARQFVYPKLGPGGRELAIYELMLDLTNLTEGTHYQLCATRNKELDTTEVTAAALTNATRWSHYATVDPFTGVDITYTNHAASPNYAAIQNLLPVGHRSLWLLPGHDDVAIPDYDIVGNFQHDSLYYGMGGSTEERIFVSGFQSFNPTSMVVAKSNYSVSCTGCEIVGRYPEICSDCGTEVHFAPSFMECGRRPWVYWTYTIDGSPRCIEVSPFPDLIIECFPDPYDKQIWTPYFSDFIHYGAYYTICLKHHGRDWGNAGVEDVFIAPAEAKTDVTLVRYRYDFYVTLTCYYVCRIVFDDLLNQAAAYENATAFNMTNGGTYDEDLVTIEKGGIPWKKYPTFTWPNASAESVPVTRHCVSECDNARGYLKGKGPFVWDKYCDRNSNIGLRVEEIPGDKFNRTFSDVIKFSDGIKKWNEPVIVERLMKLPIQTEDYAPRAFYDVCLDTGFGYGGLTTTGSIFVRDQGIKEIITRGFIYGEAEHIWVDCEGCEADVTRIFLQLAMYKNCLPQYFEGQTMTGKELGLPTAKMKSHKLWLMDSRYLTAGNVYRMCIDLDGEDSDLMDYEMVDDRFIENMETRMWFTPITRVYNPRAVFRDSSEYIFIDMAFHYYPPPSEYVKVYLSIDECKLDVTSFSSHQSMGHSDWGWDAEDSWKYSALYDLIWTEPNRGPPIYQDIIPSFNLDSDARVWWFEANLEHLRSGQFYRVCSSDHQKKGFGDSNHDAYISPVTDFYTETLEPLRRQEVRFFCEECYENETLVFLDYNCSHALEPFVRIAEVEKQVSTLGLDAEWNSLLSENVDETSYYTFWNNQTVNEENYVYPSREYHGNSTELYSPLVDFLFEKVYPDMPAELKDYLLLVRDDRDSPAFLFYHSQFKEQVLNATIGETAAQAMSGPMDSSYERYWPLVKPHEVAVQGDQYRKQLDDTLPIHTDLVPTLGFPYQIVYLGSSLLQQPHYPHPGVNSTWTIHADMSYAERGRHYELCVRRNISLPTGPSSWNIYVNPVRALLDITIKMENYEHLEFDCPVCEVTAGDVNIRRARGYLTVEENGCKEVGQISDTARVHTSAQLIKTAQHVLTPLTPGYNSRLMQNARIMQSGGTYKLCIDADGFGADPPHTNYWGYVTRRFGYALPHRLFVSPISKAGRTVLDDGNQELEFLCPYQGCKAGQSIAFFEKFVVGRSNLLICKTKSDQSSPLAIVDVATETNKADNYRILVDAQELQPGWYRLCFDYDGLHGVTDGHALEPGWTEHYVYNSGVYNAFNYGVARATSVEIFVNCNNCIPGTSIVYLSRNCEVNFLTKGANYTSNFDIEVVEIPAFPYGYKLIGNTYNLQYAWNYNLCLCLSADLVAEPIGTGLKFYVSPVQKLQTMTLMPLRYLPLRVKCIACEATSVGYISYQCETQDGLNPIYQPNGYFDLYTKEENFRKLNNLCGKRSCEDDDWGMLLSGNNPSPGLRPGRHYHLCMIQNNELGNAMPRLYVTPILKQATWNWRPTNFTSETFGVSPYDDAWIYTEPEPLYMWPHGFTVCAWFDVTPFKEQTPTKPKFPQNPIVDGERYGLYTQGSDVVRFFFRDSMIDEQRKEVEHTISAGVHHACGVFTAKQTQLQGGLFEYTSDIRLYVDGAFSSELTKSNRLQMEWDYIYTMVGSSRRYQTQFEGEIYDARVYHEPLSDDSVKSMYEEGYDHPITTRVVTRANETEINFYCYVDCVGSEVVLSLDCDDLEDETKTSGYATVTNLRSATLNTLNCRQGEKYEICWKSQPPLPSHSPYVPQWGRTGVMVFILSAILSVEIVQVTVNTVTIEVIQESTAKFHCKELLQGDGAEIFAEIPSWIRRKGSELQGFQKLTDYSLESGLQNQWSAKITFTRLNTDSDYKFICVAEENEDDMWIRYARTHLAAATSATPRLHRILGGDRVSPFHNGIVIRVATEGTAYVQCRLTGPSRYWLGDSPSRFELDPFVPPGTYNPVTNPEPEYPDPKAAPKGSECFGSHAVAGYPSSAFMAASTDPSYSYYKNSSEFLYPDEGPVNGTQAGCGYSNVTQCDFFCDVGIDGLLPGHEYEYECWTLLMPHIRPNGSALTSSPPLSCGPYSCVAIDSIAGRMTEFNQTHTIYRDLSFPVRAVSTNGKTSCGVLAADVRTEIYIRDHYVECVGSQAEEFKSLTQPYYEVALGEFHRCGIKRGLLAQLECTGQDRWGQLVEQAVYVEGAVEYKKVECAWTHCCALSSVGDLKCWGWLPSEIPMPLNTKFSDICAGRGYSCGVRSADSRIECWGTNEFGQAIIANSTVGGKQFRKVACGIHYSCAIDIERNVHCWGAFEMGQLVYSDRGPLIFVTAD